MGKRLLYIDCYRGLLILLVILGHCMQVSYANCGNSVSWSIIYSFHMAAFMFVSGYVSFYSKINKGLILKRAKQLLIPFVAWAALSSITFTSPYLSNFNDSLFAIILHPDRSYWFIWVLFFVVLFFYIGDFISKKIKVRQEHVEAVIAVVLFAIKYKTNFQLFDYPHIAYYFLFYCLGYYANKYDFMKYFNHYVVFICIGIIWMVGAWYWRMYELPSFLKSVSFVSASSLQKLYNIVIAFAGTTFWYVVANKFMSKPNSWTRALAKLGKISLGLYVIHLFIVGYLHSAFMLIFPSMDETLVAFIIWPILVLLSYLIDLVLDIFKLTAFLFLGREKS